MKPNTEDRRQKSEDRSQQGHFPRRILSSRLSSERGIALVMTLAVLVLVTLLMIGFAVSMRVENTAAKNFNDMIAARQLAQGAVDHAVATLRNATPIPDTTRTWIAMPGAILTFSAGSVVTNWLYSTNTSSFVVNLNENAAITGFNKYYSAGTPITAKLIPVGNPYIGRFGYWIDVENTKVNLNTARMRTPSDPTSTSDPLMNQSQAGDIDLRALEGNFYCSSNMAATVAGASPPLNTIAELLRTNLNTSYTDLTSNKFFIAVGIPADPDTDAFGRSRINLRSITKADIDNAGSTVRQRLNDSTWRNILYSGIINAGTATFEQKYGAFGVKQILANIIDYQSSAANYPTHDSLDANNIPSSYCGLKKGPLIDDVIVHVATNYVPDSVTTDQTNLVVHTFVDIKFVNGYDTDWGSNWVVKVLPRSITVNYTGGATAGPTTVNTFTEASKVLVSNVTKHSFRLLGSTTPSGVGSAPPPDFPITINGVTSSVPVTTSVVVSLKTVRLLMRDDPQAIVDWMAQADFDAAYPSGMTFNNTSIIPYITNATNGQITNPQFNANPNTNSLASRPLALGKQDPRVRTFINGPSPSLTTNWFALSTADINPTSNDGFTSRITPDLYNLLADVRSIEPGSTFPIHTYLIDQIAEAPMQSVGELSYIHTGYPWRTIRLRSVRPETTGSTTASPYADAQLSSPYKDIGDPNTGKETIEQNSIPDWIMLDIFTVGSTTGRLNLNSKIFHASGNLSPRIPPFTALINCTSSNLSVAVNPTIVNSIAGNIANRVFVTGSPYANVPAYLTPGEICEVQNLGYFSDTVSATAIYTNNPSKLRRQQLIRRVSNLITTRPNTFTIWAYARTFHPVSGDTTAEVKIQAIVERYEESGQVKFRTKYFRYIYD